MKGRKGTVGSFEEKLSNCDHLLWLFKRLPSMEKTDFITAQVVDKLQIKTTHFLKKVNIKMT